MSLEHYYDVVHSFFETLGCAEDEGFVSILVTDAHGNVIGNSGGAT